MIRMYPDQVARHWEGLKPAIEGALPDITKATMDRETSIFKSLMAGQLIMHLLCDDATMLIRGIMTTAIIDTIDMVERQLLLYTAYAVGETKKEDWIEAWRLLADYAKGNNCTSVVAYTNQEKILSLAKMVGCKVDVHFLRWEV